MITIIAGSESDKDLVEKVESVIKEFGVEFDSHIASAHRTPGLSAALPGAIASHTVRPVIGLPKNVKLEGLDSFLSIAQMPPGVPVATVGVDNAKNAAFLALEILAIKDAGLEEKLKEYRNL